MARTGQKLILTKALSLLLLSFSLDIGGQIKARGHVKRRKIYIEVLMLEQEVFTQPRTGHGMICVEIAVLSNQKSP